MIQILDMFPHLHVLQNVNEYIMDIMVLYIMVLYTYLIYNILYDNNIQPMIVCIYYLWQIVGVKEQCSTLMIWYTFWLFLILFIVFVFYILYDVIHLVVKINDLKQNLIIHQRSSFLNYYILLNSLPPPNTSSINETKSLCSNLVYTAYVPLFGFTITTYDSVKSDSNLCFN